MGLPASPPLTRRLGNGFSIGAIGELHRAVKDWLHKEIIGLEPEEG